MDPTYNDYYFIYKDAHGRWNHTINPEFVAAAYSIRAIHKDIVGPSISDYLAELNKEK